MPDVVEQGGQARREPVVLAGGIEFPALGEGRQRGLGQVVRAESMLEA